MPDRPRTLASAGKPRRHAHQPPAFWEIRPGSGALNEIEAKAVVKELERLCIQQGYSGTVGVVTSFRAQANRISEAMRFRSSSICRALSFIEGITSYKFLHHSVDGWEIHSSNSQKAVVRDCRNGDTSRWTRLAPGGPIRHRS